MSEKDEGKYTERGFLDYNDKVVELFRDPKNVGEMEDADVTVREGDPTCGDQIELSLKFDGDTIKDAKFLSFGCAANIATGSMLTEMIKGKNVEKVREISMDDIEDELGGLPTVKKHCAVLATRALEKALDTALDEFEKGKSQKEESSDS